MSALRHFGASRSPAPRSVHAGRRCRAGRAHGHDDERHARRQRLDDRAVAAVRDDGARPARGPRRAAPSARPERWPRRHVGRLDGVPGGDDSPHGQLPSASTIRPSTDSWSWLPVLREASTIGSSPAGAVPVLRPTPDRRAGRPRSGRCPAAAREVEVGRAQHEHAVGMVELLPHPFERRQPMLGPGRVEGREVRVPHRAALLPDRGIHLALLGVARGGEAGPEGRPPGAGSG